MSLKLSENNTLTTKKKGSERAAATLNTGTRLREGANINKSLLALANCINALSTGSERVKYRDSKLTHLLKSSLEGDCRVAMLAAITPSHKSYEESHNTLKYAHRAKNIKTSATATLSLTPSSSRFFSQNILTAVDENIPIQHPKKFHHYSPSISENLEENSENIQPFKPEQVLKEVKMERDRLAEENGELRAELQKAKETIASLCKKSLPPPPPMSALPILQPQQLTTVMTRARSSSVTNSRPISTTTRTSTRMKKVGYA